MFRVELSRGVREHHVEADALPTPPTRPRSFERPKGRMPILAKEVQIRAVHLPGRCKRETLHPGSDEVCLGRAENPLGG